MRKLVIAAAALGFTGTAYAADMPLLKAPPMMAAPSWTGFYIGVNGGGGWGTSETGLGYILGGTAAPIPAAFDNVTPNGAQAGLCSSAQCQALNRIAVVNAASNTLNPSGGMAGGQVGYLLQQGSVVGGLEAAFDWSGVKQSVLSNSAYPAGVAAGLPFSFNERVSSTWLFTFLGRVGFDLGAWYPYATAGLAVADIKYANAFSDPNSPAGIVAPVVTGPFAGAISIDQVKAGIAAGGGLEWRFDNHWSLRGEYLFISFGGVSGIGTICQVAGGCGSLATAVSVIHNASFQENVARAFLSYKW